MNRDERAAKVRDMLDAGATQQAVADELGVSLATVARDAKKPAQGIVGRVKQSAQNTVEQVKQSVFGSSIPAERLEARKKEANILFSMAVGEEFPREDRLFMTNLTSRKGKEAVLAALAAADIDVSDRDAVRRVVWSFVEAADKEHAALKGY